MTFLTKVDKGFPGLALDISLNKDDNTKMNAPALFIGHGSPMNAVSTNAFTQSLSQLASQFPKPTAICCISAHWQTRGIQILESPQPKTIHDFIGFPDELYQIQYPAPGDIAHAKETAFLIADHHPLLTAEWGLDHGTWSILRHMFPAADVPVYQISLDLSRSISDHLTVAKELKTLRENGVWIIGSGNIVHNLRELNWQTPNQGYDWAHAFDTYIKDALVEDRPDRIVNFRQSGPEGKLAVTTLDHYLPIIYLLGLRNPQDTLSFPYEGFEYGGISMRAVLLKK